MLRFLSVLMLMVCVGIGGIFLLVRFAIDEHKRRRA